ncbi:hypothetical protein [Pseudotamlana agarivorans]|uniref:hypothetical protein n=1 Tax=Pseudotamlana agarivorans TaxID=481183 RepID=UPI0008358869|nr:hypothetical protein [Tamlana agarivorans]
MKKFIFKLIKFSLPVIVVVAIFFTYAEYTLYCYPSAFQLKAKHFKQNKKNIDILILGSSHNQNAINPEIINDFSCSNLAFGGQDIRIDSALFNLVIKQLPKLKYIVLELSYHTLEHRNNINYHRNSLYLRFYNLNLFNRNINIKDYSIYLSKPNLYNRFLNPFAKKTSVNKYGFATELTSNTPELNRFENLKYNENLILNDTSNMFINRHKYEDIDAYKKNTSTICHLIDKCVNNDIIPIVISPPVYKNYFNSYIISKEKRRKDYINQILLKYPAMVYIDYEQDSRFIVTDFKDEDHLNPNGAKKFSMLLNDTINVIEAQLYKNSHYKYAKPQ